MQLEFDDLDDVDTDGLGLDFSALLNTGIKTATDLESQRRQAQMAQAAARQAAAEAAAEDARTRAIIAGRAPSGIPLGKVAMYAGAAILLSVVAIKLLRRSRR